MRPYTTTMLTVCCLASESSEITGSGDARAEMHQAQKMQEDARKCGDLLLIAEAMLEIVKTHNRESLSQLDVRIGALCCAFCMTCRTATAERTHINPVYFSLVSHMNSHKNNFIFVCVCAHAC